MKLCITGTILSSIDVPDNYDLIKDDEIIESLVKEHLENEFNIDPDMLADIEFDKAF